MAYAVENALYQWREGERRIANAPDPAQEDLESAAEVVVEALRRFRYVREAKDFAGGQPRETHEKP